MVLDLILPNIVHVISYQKVIVITNNHGVNGILMIKNALIYMLYVRVTQKPLLVNLNLDASGI